MTAENHAGTTTMTDRNIVLVTGGTGYLAGWTIIELLAQGYAVRTTVRSLKSEEQLRQRLAPYTDGLARLKLYPADLLNDAGWADALENVDFVLHQASPMSGKDVIGPAREGTMRVLKASAAAGVRRVVLTSSGFAASRPTPGSVPPGQPIDESSWTDIDQPRIGDYMRAKTLAEQDAWAFARTPGTDMELVTILPGFIQGPALNGMYSESVGLIANMLNGKMPVLPDVGLGIVDIRDLTDLHIRAMVSPEAAGQRFIASGDFLWFRDIALILKDAFGTRASKVSVRSMPDWLVRLLGLFSPQVAGMVPELGQRTELSSAKAQRLLGWTPRPAIDAIVAAGESLMPPNAFDERRASDQKR
ncbi:NAD-dependent epimerase/dehydratase family protein [Aquamicrobium sp. NLF2-7]|uniref:NAD-dependent epimerase/dehydratase family protein n=1 Tax=Aquamicrobium sp. NLF2-7 TaxID=2918753 RepID=UPI001EFB9C89|nr:NAD-dependent epimerase/dehydratase family protein [Aquamicrobium sp. NLF2-7]MCG8273873.1 NAD-dependent epimerase/dehydratase family protein [Aquamicrobium sp. NLF2-7]